MLEKQDSVMREAYASREFVTPKLVQADWSISPHPIGEQPSFFNQDETIPPDGQRGKGLFAYLPGLAGEGVKGSQREVIANVFIDEQNRMFSGFFCCATSSTRSTAFISTATKRFIPCRIYTNR